MDENTKAHWLQHVPFEGLGKIMSYLSHNDVQITSTKLFEGEPLPELDDFDILVVMGGPMSISDEAEYPWLKEEKALVKAAIEAGKKVLGVCLGAQIIAEVLGAKVYKNPLKEIGWFEIRPTDECLETPYKEAFGRPLKAFHWHSDTYDIPEGAVNLCESSATKNQAFLYKDNALGLQFHIEMSTQGIDAILQNCSNEIDGSEFTQNPKMIKQLIKNSIACNMRLFALLDVFFGKGEYIAEEYRN